MTFRFRPRAFALLAPLALVFTLAGCHHRETRVEVGNREQIIHIGNLSEPTDLDPQTISSLQDFQIVNGLIEGLTNYSPVDCHPIPGVATSWKESPDHLTWTFTLRPEAAWSNGDPVTAHDFVYAYHRILSARLGAEYAYMLFCLSGGEDFYQGKTADFSTVGAQAPDDHTLVLHLAHPVPYLPALVAHSAWYPVHRTTIEKFGAMDDRGTLWTRPGNFVGNGAFVLKKWIPNQVITLEPNPHYWDRASVRLHQVNYYPIEAASTEEAAFRAGQLHVTVEVPSDKIAVYKREHPELLLQSTNLATYFYRFNTRRPPLDDPRVRLALSMAIDRHAIVTNVVKGGQVPAFTLTPPGMEGYQPEVSLHENVAEARRLLAEAGFPDGKGFPVERLLYNNSEGHQRIAEAIQQMWRKNLGIEVQLYNQEAKVYTDTMRQGDYDIARYAWIGDYIDPSTFLELMLSDSGNNQTGWANPGYDRLVNQARNAGTTAERFAFYREAESILMKESPIMPIYFYVQSRLIVPAVKGWHGNLLDIHPAKDLYLETGKP